MSKTTPQDAAFFDLDDDEGWEDMPVVREDEFAGGLDEEDQKKYHYKPQDKKEGAPKGGGNALGEVLDVDAFGKDRDAAFVMDRVAEAMAQWDKEHDGDL